MTQMTIPESLAARKAELERDIKESEREATLFGKQAELQRAELRGLIVAIEAYTAAEVPVIETLPTRLPRRDLRAMVLNTVRQSSSPIDTHWLGKTLNIKPSQVVSITRILYAQGKIVGDDTAGWRLPAEEFIEQAAE